MSQENVEIVRRHIEAFNRRDLSTWVALFSSDAEIDWSRARGPFKGFYRGRRGQEAFWEVWLTFDYGKVEAHDFREAGSEVVVPNTAIFRGRQGIEVTARSAFVFTVESEQIVRYRIFQKQAEALEAARLRE